MFPQLDVVTDPDLPLKDKITYFAAINLHHGANAEEKETKTIKEKIKEMVESPMTRYEGLLLFEAALQQNTPFYVEIWPRIIIANLISSDTSCQEIVYRILTSIIKSSKYAAHLTTVQYHVPKILELLTEPNNTNCVAAMQCLALCIKACPAAVISRKDELESFIMKQMDTNSSQISEAISDCFVNLFCSTSSIDRDINSQKQRMLSNYKKLLYTMQEIINKLVYSTNAYAIGNDDKTRPQEIFPLPEMPDVQISAILTYARIFNSLSSCTAKILCSEYQEKMQLEVPVIWILEFISRVFDVIQHTKQTDANETQLIYLAYPIILRGAFIILESLIQNFSLVEQVENVILLIRKGLESSYVATFTQNTSNCQIRYMSWRLLNLWINKNGTQVSIDAGNKKFLIAELLKDTIPVIVDEEPVTMIARHHPPTKLKKAECAFPEPGENSNFNKLKMNTSSEALKVLKSFIYTASPFLEEKFKEEITTSILSSAKKVQKYLHPQKKFPFPYMNDKCRKNLYELCLAFIVTSSFPIRVVMHSFAILKIAQKDQNLKIRGFCHIATPLYRLLLHPKKKFPEVVTNKKALFEPNVEENVYFGWDNVTTWNGNSERNAHFSNQNAMNCRQDNLSPEAHNSINENEIQNYVSEKEYNSSEYESASKVGNQCNGEDLSEVQVSSQSDSESEGTMENEVSEEQVEHQFSGKPYITTVHSIAKDDTVEHDVSSEYDQMSVAEEELDESKNSEEESKPSMRSNAVICNDQNGIASTSDEEVPSSSRGENAEYSSEEDGSYEEEEEESKELFEDQIQTVETIEEIVEEEAIEETIEEIVEEAIEETIEETEPPLKKQRVDETPDEEDQVVEEVVDDVKEEEVVKENNGIIEKECNEEEPPKKIVEEESSRSKSPTFEQMCQDLVICESAKLAAES